MNAPTKGPAENVLSVSEAIPLMKEHVDAIRSACTRRDDVIRETSIALAESGGSPRAVVVDVHKRAMSVAPVGEDPVRADNKELHTRRVEAAADACQVLLDSATAITAIFEKIAPEEQSICREFAGDVREAQLIMVGLGRGKGSLMEEQERFALLRSAFNNCAPYIIISYEKLMKQPSGAVPDTEAEVPAPVAKPVEKLTTRNMSPRLDAVIRKSLALSDWSEVVTLWRSLMGEVVELFGAKLIGQRENPQQEAILDMLQDLGERFDEIVAAERAAGRGSRWNSLSIKGLAMTLFSERVPGYPVMLGPKKR